MAQIKLSVTFSTFRRATMIQARRRVFRFPRIRVSYPFQWAQRTTHLMYCRPHQVV
jgi:hypothetical protein